MTPSLRRAVCGLAAAALLAPSGAAAGVRSGPALEPPTRKAGASIARIVMPTIARRGPGARRRVARIGVATAWSGQPQSLLVLRSAVVAGRQWLKVLLPQRPNGSTGWIPRRRAVITHTRYWITVHRGARLVTVYGRGRVRLRFRAVVGKPGTPTPVGLAAIYEINRQPDPNGFLGPWALPLTALSDVLYDYGGGPGRVAIHGRGGASLRDPLGTARSHGCVRIDNRPVSWMARTLKRGTPVQILP